MHVSFEVAQEIIDKAVEKSKEIGVKMCIADYYKVPIEISLAFIILTLSVAVLTSMVMQRNDGVSR